MSKTIDKHAMESWLRQQTKRFKGENFGGTYTPTKTANDNLLGIFQFTLDAGFQLDSCCPFGAFGGECHLFLDNNMGEASMFESLDTQYHGLCSLVVGFESLGADIPPPIDTGYQPSDEVEAASHLEKMKHDEDYIFFSFGDWLKEIPEWRYFVGGADDKRLLEWLGFPIGTLPNGKVVCAMSPPVYDRNTSLVIPTEAYTAACVLTKEAAAALDLITDNQFAASAYSKELFRAGDNNHARAFIHGAKGDWSPQTTHDKIERWLHPLPTSDAEA